MDFDFITDEKFRNILTRDFEELQKCIDCKASKSVLILSGSIIEAVLSDYFINFPPPEINSKKVLTMEMAKLIELAFENKLISQSTRDLTTVVKNYRNHIHPGREIRKNESFDFDSALVAKSLLNIILKEIKENYIKNVGHTATDIISKLENDSISQPLFEKLINKLHKSEKVKLYNLLVEYDLQEVNFPSQLNEPKKYISTLKPQVDRSVVTGQLMKLVNKIEKGEKWEVMTYYYLLFEDINYLDENNIEIILLYIINALAESTRNSDELQRYVNKTLFANLGLYLITDDIKKEFLNLCCKIVTNYKSKEEYIYFNAYDQLINSISQDKKEKVKEYILTTLSTYYTDKFYKGYSDGDYLPF